MRLADLFRLGTASSVVGLCAALLAPAQAEILAMMNYESKPAEELKSLKLSGEQPRREGIAIVDVDPESEHFGRILMDIPLDPQSVTHHIFYDRTMTKAYITSLMQPALQVLDMTRNPYRLKTIAVPNCKFAEDVIFDEANARWYLTCMASANVYVGRVEDDSLVGEIALPGTYPHGLAVNTALDRVLVTSTITPDLSAPAETVSVVQASTLEPLGEIKMSSKPSPSGEAPVEILFAPGAEPPTALVTNMFGHALWTLTWDADAQTFVPAQVFDFQSVEAGVPLEMYFNEAGDRLYVTTSAPGHLHIFDVSGGVAAPKLIASVPTAGGAHHVGITKDGRLGFVQNSFLNLPKMSDGSVTVVDLETGERLASMDTLKTAGFNPNSIVLLPEWNSLAGH